MFSSLVRRASADGQVETRPQSPCVSPRRFRQLESPSSGLCRKDRTAFGPLPVADRRLAFFGADFVDDLQDAFAVGAELHAEFLHHPAVVDQIIARPFPAAGFVVEGDLRVGQEFAHEVGQIAQADRVAAGIVDGVVWLVLRNHAKISAISST